MSHRKTELVGVASIAGALVAVGFALAGVPAGVERDEATGGDRYALDCRVLMATDNDTIPPTLFGRASTKSPMSFLGVATITNGRLGETKLGGNRFAMFGKAASDWRHGRRFEALSLYLDDDATPAQRRAMATIFTHDPLFRSETLPAVSTIKISMESVSRDPLVRTRVALGSGANRGVIEFAPMKGKDGRNPVAIANAFTFFEEHEPVGLAVARVRFSDHGRELDVANGSGEIHYIRLEGTVRGVVEEPSTPPEEEPKAHGAGEDEHAPREDR